MSEGKLKRLSHGPSRASPLQVFRRTLHTQKNLRNGLAAARTVVKPTHFPMIVRELSRSPIYRTLLTPLTFPLSLSALTQTARLEALSTEGELLWCASILSLYVEELNQFIKHRDGYYKAYVDGDYDRAEKILCQIEESLGFSLWVLGNRLLLLQVTKGLQAQKTLLEEIISTEGINQFVAWIAYFISVRAEDNVSYASFEAELEGVFEISWLRDYVRLHLLPYEFASIEHSGLPISVEEPHPIIDRFETFVAMCLNACAKKKREDLSHVVLALEQVEGIDDLSIRRMIMVLRDGYAASESGFLASADAYTEGRYQDILDSGCEGLELLSRAHGFLERRPQVDGSSCLRNQIVALMYDISSLSPDASKSRQTLKKLALLCPDRSLTLEVTAFLQRTDDYVAAEASKELDVAMALSRSLDNPWSTSALDRVCSGAPWLTQLLAAHPDSPALKLRLALTTGDVAAIERNEMQLPSYRQAMYEGHIRFRTGDFISAATHYSLAIDSSIDFIAHAARRALFKAYYANGQLYEAVQLVIDQSLTTPSAAQSFPLEALARQYLKCEDAGSSIDLAVLLHLATRYGNAKLERDLSNIYENVMEAEGVDRPSALQGLVERYKRDRLIYFLRYICVPRVLDDTTCFDSVEEIDLERIAICQLLLEIDPQNVATYQAEIRAITRGSEVASLLCKMQTSKIYVDEAGIREVLEVSLAESLARYLKLLSSPSLAYQAEKLSKRLSEMLSSKGHPEFKDLKLPASELEGLFNAMLLDVVSEFALNPAYGLDTHVSTSIRHGAFEGHLRRPLVTEDLLCLKKGNEYILPPTWRRKLQSLADPDFDLLQRHLAKFSQRFDEIVLDYLKRKLHVRLLGDDIAMFDFHADPAEAQSLMDGITPNTTLNDLTDRLIAHCWHLTTRSLDAIRADLNDSAAKQIGSAFDTLVRGIESKLEHSTVTPFIDAVARARTAFQIAIGDVADWFQRPTDLSRDPFDIEVATHVALQQIANCYVQNPLQPVLNLATGEKIDGRMLDGLCEILFILLQNVILHSGLGEQRAEVSISAGRQGGSLILECKSKLGDDISLTERRNSAVEAMGRYERDSALKMARKEGGSGLSKVWRIAEFDLRVQHKIELAVTDDREFVVRLSLGGLWV